MNNDNTESLYARKHVITLYKFCNNMSLRTPQDCTFSSQKYSLIWNKSLSIFHNL